MTDTQTETNVRADEPTTVSLPGGTGIKMPNGELLNPIYASLKSLTRMGEAEYGAALAWVEVERKRVAAQLAEREAQQKEIAAAFHKDAEAQAAALAAAKEKEPWRF